MSQNVEDLLNEEDDVEDDYNLDIDQEEKLLRDDNTEVNETSENELDESEDVLTLDIDDDLEEEDAEGRRAGSGTASKFTSERLAISPIEYNNEKEPENQKVGKKHQNVNSFQLNRGRGRFNKQQKWKPGNKTVHINPHFKGDVQINGNARLKWDSAQNQKYPGNQNRAYGNFKQPMPRIEVWERQRPQNMQERRMINPQPYVNPPNAVFNDLQVAQSYPQPQMQQLVTAGPIPQMQYNPPPTQFFQNREVYSQQPPLPPASFYQPPPQQVVMNQQCYQPPIVQPNYCNNPVYSHQFNTPPQSFPVNTQPVIYNTPPPPLPQGDYCRPCSMQPPVNYCRSIESGFERVVQQNRLGYGQSRQVVQAGGFAGKQQQKKRFTNKNFEAGGHRKKRVVESGNLHEIRPVENVQVVSKKPKEETAEQEIISVDEDYLRKIEEQKRLREKILREKELKRLQKAAEQNPNPIAKLAANPNFVKRQNLINNQKNRNQNRNLVQINQQPADEPANIKIEVAALNAARVIQLRKEEEGVGLTKGFLSNRMVLTNDQSLVNTPIVIVKNLSAGTTESKLQKMCQGIGEVQTLHLSREERQATIRFKSVASAHAFYKKYQRYMLDLSMIQVHLQTV